MPQMVTSKIIESMRDDLVVLRAVDAIDKRLLCAFGEIYRPPVQESGADLTGQWPARSNGSTTQGKRRAGRM